MPRGPKGEKRLVKVVGDQIRDRRLDSPIILSGETFTICVQDETNHLSNGLLRMPVSPCQEKLAVC